MARLIVVIDARRAREGADQYAAAQDQIRTSARRTAEETAASNQRSIESTLAALDREIDRRKAVVEAQSRGVAEGRIEAKAQETINALRAKGITLSDQEIAKIREKTRASQELANAIESTIRAARNAEQANAIAGAQRGRAYEQSSAGPVQGPMTQDQAIEEARKKTEALSRTLNEARGWIGDVGDAFDYVGKQILGLSDSQSQAVSTTIMMTEKGMALGEVFGPQAAILGGLAGMFVAMGSAAIQAHRANTELIRSMDAYQKKVADSLANDAMQRHFERLYTGSERLRNSLAEIAKINVSDVVAGIEKASKIKLSDSIGGMGSVDDYNRAQAEIQQSATLFVEDIKRSYEGLSSGLDGVLAKNRQVAAQETENIGALQGRYAEAEAHAKKTEENIRKHQQLLASEGAILVKQIEEAQAAYDKDPSVENQKKLVAALNNAATMRQQIAGANKILDAEDVIAQQKKKEAYDRLQGAIEKNRTSLAEIGKELLVVGKRADSVLAGGYLGKLAEVVGSDAFAKAVKDKEAKDKAAKTAAESAARSRADSLKQQQEQIAAQQAIWAAYERGGEEAAKIEEKYQSLIAGKGYNAAQLAQARQNAEQIVANENRITDARKTATDAEREKQKVEEDARKAREKAIEEAKKAADALEEIEAKATKPGMELTEKQKSPAEVWIEQYDSMVDAQMNFQNIVVGSFDTIASSLAQTLWGVDTDWAQVMRSMGIELTELLIKMAAAAALKAVISGATGGIGGVLGAGIIGDLIVGASFHGGGKVGAGGSPIIAPASLFSAAPRFHGGLKADEFPAILQTGEEVLSRQQVAEGRGGSGGKTINITNYFPDVKDSRGFARSIGQQSSRLRRALGGTS